MASYSYLAATILGYVVSQSIKVILGRRRGESYLETFSSGGGPSVHVASMASLLLVIGGVAGIDSPIFALTFTLTAVVAYDALGVRRTTGENATAIRDLQRLAKLDTGSGKAARLMLGHTPVEVVQGFGLGFAVGLTILSVR